MRCTTCGFPLAPYRTICPRCGAANETGGRKPSKLRTKLQSLQTPQPQEQGTIQPLGQEQTPNQQPQQENYQAGQMLFSNQNAPAQMQHPPVQEPVQPAPWKTATPPPFPGVVQQRARFSPRSRPSGATNVTRFRLSIAAICVAMGGLILLLVYFMAPGVLTTPTQQASTAPHTPANSSHATTPTPHTVTATPKPAATATATGNSGQKYIDNAQMASAVDTQTAEPLTPTTAFQSGQAIYVTFSVHANTVGAACLYWYLQDQPIANYQMPVGPVTQDYSWAYYQGNGTARVDIYWASTTDCTDKVLAQSVDFMVSG